MSDMATIDLPYIEKNISRHGTMRYYFRIDGKRLGRLPDNPDSEAFGIEYWRLRNGLSAPEWQTGGKETLSAHPKPGTFHHMCAVYLQSSAYTALDKTTQGKRRSIIDSMLLEPLSPDSNLIFAHMPIGALNLANIEVLRDRKRETPFAADERLKILRQIFVACMPTLVKQNTAKIAKSFRKQTEGHSTMRPDEVAQYVAFHGNDSKAVLALAILMYTGLRVSDLAAVGPQHRRGESIVLRVFKNRNRNPTTIEIPVHPILDAVMKMHKTTALTYMVTDYGLPFSIKGLSQRVSDWFSQAGLRHLTAHSVRKGLATNIAENEATDLMLEGMFGWKDGKTSKIYTRNAQRSRLARQAVSKIDWGKIGNMLPHPQDGEEFQTDISEKKAL